MINKESFNFLMWTKIPVGTLLYEISARHYIRLALLLVLVSSGARLFAQTKSFNKVEQFIPPSPTALEFIKYGEYPVGMYTGVPEITIPIYDIKSKDIALPISLSYHSSGIQVDQIASWVGLGWSLNAGGTISKIPRGRPDDDRGFLTYDVPELNALEYDSDFYEQAATGEKDTESDIYYYNVAGRSGKFFFGRDKKPRLIDETPIRIVYSNGEFVITDENGTKYNFSIKEQTEVRTFTRSSETYSRYTSTWHLTSIVSSQNEGKITFNYVDGSSVTSRSFDYTESTGDGFDTSTCPPGIQQRIHTPRELTSNTLVINSPKRLHEILFPNGKVVFERATDRLDVVQDRLKEIVVFKKTGSDYFILKSFELVVDHFYSSHTNVISQYPLTDTDPRRYRLRLNELIEYDQNRINTKKHTFDYNSTMLPPLETNPKDFWGYYNGKLRNGGLIPRQPYHYYGNPVGEADRNPDPEFMKAGVLTKITYPTGGFTEFSYEPHEYISSEPKLVKRTFSISARGDTAPYESVATITPTYSSYATVSMESSDMTDSHGGTFPRITLREEGVSNYLIDHRVDPYAYNFPLDPPTVNKRFSPVYLEEGKTYHLKIEVKGNSSSTRYGNAAFINSHIDYQEVSEEDAPAVKIAGGLRVQEIRSYSQLGILAFAKKYEYKQSNLITPEQFLKEQYLDVEIEYWKHCKPASGQDVGPGTLSCLSSSVTRRFYYGGTVRSLTLYGGSPVVYGAVDEIKIDEFGNELGKTAYAFTTHSDEPLQTFVSYKGGIMLLKKDWTGGKIASKRVFYKNTKESPDPIYSEKYEYVTKRDKASVYSEAYKMYKIVHGKAIVGDCRVIKAEQFEVVEYPIYSGVLLLNRTMTTSRDDDGNELVAERKIKYENELHLQPTRTETTTSDEETLVTKTFYPDDITSTTSLEEEELSEEEFNAIYSLKDSHRISVPIQQETWKNGVKLSTFRTSYKMWYNNNQSLQPEMVKFAKGNDPLQIQFQYHSYDYNANPIMISKEDGPITSYFWGYNGLSIAKIENATQVEIAEALGTSIYALKSYSEDNLPEINSLREKLPKAMVTTYTYDPLIGMTSMTDPNGLTTYYEYDSFGRLYMIKDHQNNILKEYEYNYKDPED